MLRRDADPGLPVVKLSFGLVRVSMMFDSFSDGQEIRTKATVPATLVWQLSGKRTRFCAPLKRAFDIAAAITVLLVFFWAYLAIAIAVRMESRGPVLFRQRRTGLNGTVFTIYKFRSMTVTEDGYAIAHATRDDDRVTRVGAFIRATSLDELPQLLNVIRGEMSLVGPRPHAVAHDAHYGDLLPRYAERFAVRPGLTGLAQIGGHRGEIHELDCMARRVNADADYAARWSFLGDLAIIVRTIPLLLARTNAY